jgi:branched-chain amino acid transport system permease protein
MIDTALLGAALWPALVNGLTMGAIYALIALGLTLIYGVLHIINFAHGSLLMLAMYGVLLLAQYAGIGPYTALVIVVPAMAALGYALQRYVINPARHGRDENTILATLGLSIIIENLASHFFKTDTRQIETAWTWTMIDVAGAPIAAPRLLACLGALASCALLALLMRRTDLGRAIRAVAREPQGARAVGIDVEQVFAASFAIGLACLGAAACFLLPAYYVSPQVGHGFVLVAFTVVVLGGMGSFIGSLVGGLLIGVIESLGGLLLGESLGQIGVFAVFIAILLFRPAGLFGQRR